jgi:transcriptional regulator with XRE-family HTH domain
MKRVTLKQARLAKDWTQAQLAEASGIPAPHISQLESGTIPRPEFATMDKLAQALGMTALLSVAGLVFEERSEP